jgi:diacylglycerol kinase family enzyme
MQVALFHNASAGSENHTAADLVTWVRRAGHQVLVITSSLRELQSLFGSRPVDLVAVAGGDGTVSLLTCHLAPLPCPLTILPFGTANDVALSLDMRIDSPGELIAGWDRGKILSFHLGSLQCHHASSRGSSVCFAEAVGWGAFADLVSASKSQSRTDDRHTRLRSDRLRFLRQLERAQPRFYQIDIDGSDRSGEYLVVEVLNVPIIGPQLRLCSKNNPGDGLLELVLVGEEDRSALMASLDGSTAAPELALPCYSGRRIDVTCRARNVHIDGEPRQLAVNTPQRFVVELTSRSTPLLVPKVDDRPPRAGK